MRAALHAPLVVWLVLVLLPASSRAQFFELRSPFEKFRDYRMLVSSSVSTPANSQWDEKLHGSSPSLKKVLNWNQAFSIDYWKFRAGVRFFRIPQSIQPYIYWNPEFDIDSTLHIGGDSSRWALSIRAENLFAKGVANEFVGDGQSDKSTLPDRNSLSFLFAYWMGSRPDTASMNRLYEEAISYSENDPREDVLGNSDTNAPTTGVRYSVRNGLSIGFGLGEGKYSGSGPISRHLNFFRTYNVYTDKGFPGINPLFLVRYRLRNLVAQLDLAGDDLNMNFVLRNLRKIDIETGILHLEHLFQRSSRGPHRPEAYLTIRFAVGPGDKDGDFEYGDNILDLGADTDGDGVRDRDELMVYHTDPNLKDTDGDGINDGDEVKTYRTNPLSPDTDGDGIPDGDEVRKYHTNARLVDSDGDGISDGDEVKKYSTNPLKRDSDGDGLADGDEVKMSTDPLKPDTDGDGLTDGEEVINYHTSPRLVDTDGDGPNDQVEVEMGTNPLNADTDGDGVPDAKDKCPLDKGLPENDGCPASPKVGVNLDIKGIDFETGKSVLLPTSIPIMERADSILRIYPTIRVSIQGHTDNVGDSLFNKRLSLERANAVRDWLVTRGISAKRIETVGYGQDRPIATNMTEEGRQANRRIEMFVISQTEGIEEKK